MHPDLSDTESQMLILDQHATDEVLKLITDVVPGRITEYEFLIDYRLFGLLFVAPLKGHICTDERVEKHSKAPNVSLEVTRLVLKNLRGHVTECPCLLPDIIVLFRRKFAGEAKVADSDLGLRHGTTDEDIEVFQVSVHDTILMHISHTAHQLYEHSTGLILGEARLTPPAQVTEEVATFRQLRHDVG